MRKTKLLIILTLLCFATISKAQTSIEEVIEAIDFQEDTILSVFNWMTENIAYDVSILTAANPQKRFKESKKARISKTLKTKKGVCQDYSEMIDTIVKQLGYISSIVSGYTKDRQGKINSDIGHAWNAIKSNGDWKLYDATWGAGYVTDKKKFVKKYNNSWHETPPSEMIKTHMPYDPIWQLTEDVISYRHFEKGEVDKNLSLGDMESNRTKQLTTDEISQTKDALSRAEKLGPCHALVRKWKDYQNEKLVYFSGKDDASAFNNANKELRSISDNFRIYISARKKRFRDKTWTKQYCINYLSDLKHRSKEQVDVLSTIKPKQRDRQKSLRTSISQTRDLIKTLDSELTFIKNNR